MIFDFDVARRDHSMGQMHEPLQNFYAGLIASAALIVSFSVASATDLPETVPEVVIAPPAVGGWYLRGDIGYSWNGFKRAESCPAESIVYHISGQRRGGDTLYGDLNGSFLIGGGAGYQVTDYFRTDLTARLHDALAFQRAMYPAPIAMAIRDAHPMNAAIHSPSHSRQCLCRSG